MFKKVFGVRDPRQRFGILKLTTAKTWLSKRTTAQSQMCARHKNEIRDNIFLQIEL